MIVEAFSQDYVSLLLGDAPKGLRLADTPIAAFDVLRTLADLTSEVGEVFLPASWLIVHEGEIVGLCAITQPPETGSIDIGYGVAPSRQNRGIAGTAIGEIVAWAKADERVRALTAETTFENLASRRVLARNGFCEVGSHIDEDDGPVIRWRCPTGSPHDAAPRPDGGNRSAAAT